MNQITAEQVEQIQALLRSDDAAVSFYKRGTSEDEGSWYVTNSGISEFGPLKDGDFEFHESRDMEEFLKFAQENELSATVNLTSARDDDRKFDSWDSLAAYMGLSDLVVLSTKVPKKISEKLRYYAAMNGASVSQQLRDLTIAYVIQSIKENAEEDAFR